MMSPVKYARTEREQRFLLAGAPVVTGQSVRLIEDWYLDGPRLRLRVVREEGQDPVYKLGQKIRPDTTQPSTVAHTTLYLDRSEFETLRILPGRVITKVRTLLPWDDLTMAADVFTGRLQGLVLAESNSVLLGCRAVHHRSSGWLTSPTTTVSPEAPSQAPTRPRLPTYSPITSWQSEQVPAVEIIVLSGPAGVGKTTVGRRLAGAVSDGVCIHGDALRDFVVTRGPGRPNGLAYVGAAALTGVYAAAGYTRIVIEYVVEDPAHFNRFRGALPPDLGVAARLFTLWAPLPVVISREATRAGRQGLGLRVVDCWSTIQANLESLGTVIDADRPLDDVLADLEQRLHLPAVH